jgi:hypothetical protein
MRSVAAILLAVLAAWLSQGTMAIAEQGRDRIAVLPATPAAIGWALLAGIVVAALIRLGGARRPVLLLLLVLLPWIPGRTPAIAMLWSGPILIAVWAAALGAMAATIRWPRVRLPIGERPVARAGLLALAIYTAAAWGVAPVLPAGDEPHYLIITQSLLLDHDLRIENNHARGDYRAYFAGDLSKPDYLKRGKDGEIYSIHAPGVSALVAPAFALAGYRGVMAFLLLLSAAAAALAWELTRRVTGRTDAAWFGWAAVVLSPALLLNAFTVYPDGPGGLIVLTGVWALVRLREERTNEAESAWPWFFHGAALALLPWLHTRFALLAGGIGAIVVLDLARTRNPAAKASAFLVVPTISALAWIGFFVAIYGAPDPAIPYRGSDLGSPAYIPGGLGGLFFDQMYGLFANAPVLVAAVLGWVALVRRAGADRRLALQLAFIVLPYVLTVTHFAMWWGGYSSPARFLVALLPSLAIPAGVAWAAARERTSRAALAGALGITAALSLLLVTVDRGRLAYFDRGGVFAPWIGWANSTVDLAHGLPAYFARVQRQRPGALFFDEAAVWIAAFALAILALRAAARRRWLTAPGAAETATGFAFAAAIMLSVVVVWRIEDVDGRSPASAGMHLLRTVADSGRLVAIDLGRPALRPAGDLIQQMELRLTPVARGAGPGREDRGLFVLPAVPAGEYQLRLEENGSRGWLMAGIGAGRDQFALVTEPVDVFASGVTLRLPVDVRALIVRGDEGARAGVRSLLVRPVSIQRRAERLTDDVARRAVRYDGATVFFMDDRSFPEPAGFWIGGGRSSSVVIQPDARRRSASIEVRNGPVDNIVTVASGAWREELRLAPGESRRLDVPLDPARGAVLVTFDAAAGFRPNAVDPSSRDTRFLGVWVAIE